MVSIGVFILRMRYPDIDRPYKVPFYPILPIIFSLTCAWLLWSSLVYSGKGALIGVACLALGCVVLFFEKLNPSVLNE